jgi:hypothetical protein
MKIRLYHFDGKSSRLVKEKEWKRSDKIDDNPSESSRKRIEKKEEPPGPVV